MFWRARARGSQTPAARCGERSSHGQNVSSPISSPGRITPPTNAPFSVNEPMRIVVSVTISCSHRKYHGALAGLGVTSALAGSSSGEAMNTDMMLTTAMVPSVAIAARRSRSGTALTVVSGASSDCGADHRRRCPAGDAEQRVGLGRHHRRSARGARATASCSARARPPSLRTRHM